MRLLNLAPHCTVPPMDGADRRAWHLQESMVERGADALFLGRDIISDGGKSSPLPGKGPGWRNQKNLVAMAAALTGRNYWQLKMLTPSFTRAVAKLHAKDFQATIVHFFYSLPLIYRWRGEQMRLLVETHNYDPTFYAGLRDASRNPVLRYLCDQATRTSLRRLKALPQGTTLVHVSESDSAAYQLLRPDLNHVVIENGCKIAPRTTAPDYRAPGEKQLLFVGSLFAKMNQDALFNFSKVFWPTLRGVARMRVVGSQPSAAVTALCATEGWDLRANVSDAELVDIYASAHYAIAPFTYGAGSKLKLMEACGRGVPFLATKAGVTGLATIPPCIHVTDNPEEWKRIVQGGPPTEEALRETMNFAEQVSWPSLGAKLLQIVEDATVVKIHAIN